MRRWLPAALIAGAVIFSLAVYSKLPDQVPVHWGLSGEPDRYASRERGAFLAPGIMLLVWAAMTWLPSRDPRAANIAKFRESYDAVVALIMAFMAGLHLLTLGTALGWPIDVTTAVLVGVGLLLVVVGNLLPRARSNFIFGIRTPWTLSSDAVWTSSHRVGGYSMVAAGVLTVVAAFLRRPAGIFLALASLLIGGLAPVVYSYIAWSREKGDPRAD